MARNVTIDIKAKTSQYERAMKSATKSTDGLNTSLGGFAKTGAAVGAAAIAVGVAAIGVAAVKVGIESAKAFAQFEKSLAQMEGLVGVAKGQVAEFAEGIKTLAVDSGRGPQELAEAMFFITSAGLEGAAALDALDVSAKAAAAGLGDTSTIADVVTSAMNAYGDSLGGASVATDVLVASVREGKASAPELAASLGSVIPIASAMGVEFDEVGAAIAAMTRTGLNAAEAGTALRSILNSLLAPTSDAKLAMQQLGLSASGLRSQIADDGLYNTLVTLNTAFEGQDEAITRVFGNVRALTGVMSLMGSSADATGQIFDSLADATGALDTAFGVASETGAFAFEQAAARIDTAFLEVGENILPKLADALDRIAPQLPSIVGAFGDLAIIMTDLGTSAIPPIVDFLEKLPQYGRGFEKIVAEGKRFSSTFQQFATLGIAAEAFDSTDRAALKFLNTQIKIVNALTSGADPYAAAFTGLKEMAENFGITEGTMKALQDQMGFTDTEMLALTDDFIGQARALGILVVATDGLEIAMQDVALSAQFAGSNIGGTSEQVYLFESSLGQVGGAATSASAGVDQMILPLHQVRNALMEAEEANRSLADAMLEMVNPAFKAVKAVEAYNKAQSELAKVEKDAGTKISIQEAEAIAKAELAVLEATLKAQGALDAFGFDPTSLEGSIQSIETVLGKTRDEAILMLETLGILDGTQIAMLLKLETSVTGPLSGALEGAGLSDFELRLPTREHGGSVTGGKPYMVGEAGEELFIPNTSGTIIPNNALTTTGTSTAINVTFNVAADTAITDIQTGLVLSGVTDLIDLNRAAL